LVEGEVIPMKSEDVFEAVSHPLRIRILRALEGRPMRFSDLKRRLGVRSGGHLDFHLKKLDGLITVDEAGRYALTEGGYKALQAIEVISRYGWQRRSLLINIALCLLVDIYTLIFHREMLIFILPPTMAWMAFYTYWSLVRRGVRILEPSKAVQGRERDEGRRS